MFFGDNQSCFEKEKKMFTSFCISAIGKLLWTDLVIIFSKSYIYQNLNKLRSFLKILTVTFAHSNACHQVHLQKNLIHRFWERF